MLVDGGARVKQDRRAVDAAGQCKVMIITVSHPTLNYELMLMFLTHPFIG